MVTARSYQIHWVGAQLEAVRRGPWEWAGQIAPWRAGSEPKTYRTKAAAA